MPAHAACLYRRPISNTCRPSWLFIFYSFFSYKSSRKRQSHTTLRSLPLSPSPTLWTCLVIHTIPEKFINGPVCIPFADLQITSLGVASNNTHFRATLINYWQNYCNSFIDGDADELRGAEDGFLGPGMTTGAQSRPNGPRGTSKLLVTISLN